MAATKSELDRLLDRVIQEAIVIHLKPRGFKKKGRTFHRRLGEVVQLVNVQLSQGSDLSEKSFYVNVGLAFDAVCGLQELSVVESPKDYECESRGTIARLEEFFPESPHSWELSLSEDANPLIDTLGSVVSVLSVELDKIQSIADYRNHPWFNRFRPAERNAQILYLLGDLDGAWAEVQSLAEFFNDRRNADNPRWWVEELRLDKLRPRLGQ